MNKIDGIIRAVGNMMIGRVGIQRLELIRILDRAEFGNIERAVGSKLDAQHVVNPHRRHHRSDQIRVLRDHRSHQQAAITAAEDRQFFRARPLLVN